MSFGQSIRSSSKWLVGSSLVGQALQFAFGVILARLLVPADFGMIVTISIFTGFVGLIASGGLGQALIRAKEASEKDFQVVFSVQLGSGVLIYAGFFSIAPWFADWFNNPVYKDLLRISALTFLIRPFLNLHSIWLQREMRFKETSTIGLFTSAITGIVSISMALGGFGVWSLVWGGLLGSIVSYLLIARVTPLHSRLRFDRHITQQHSGFGFKIILNDFISYLRGQTSNFIVTKMAGASMVGLFNKGDSLAKLPFATISGPIYQPVFRSMAAEQDNPDRIKYLFFRMVALLILYTLPFYVGLWWLAEPFIVVVYGAHWVEAAIPLQILAPLGVLYCVGHPCGAVLAATNRLGREVMVQTITWIMVSVGLLFRAALGIGRGRNWHRVKPDLFHHSYVSAGESVLPGEIRRTHRRDRARLVAQRHSGGRACGRGCDAACGYTQGIHGGLFAHFRPVGGLGLRGGLPVPAPAIPRLRSPALEEVAAPGILIRSPSIQ